MCELSINNIAGRNHFTSIPGNHVGQNNNANVRLVEALFQRTRIVPTIICQTFSNAEEIYMIQSEIDTLDETSFGACTRLTRLILSYNHIHNLPANLFRSNTALTWLSLNNNEVSQINENAFTGTQLSVIELYNNRLSSFNPSWFESVNATLEIIDAKRNLIREISSNGFSNLRNLNGIELSYNQGLRIPSNTFDALSNLRALIIDDIGLRSVDAGWFRSTPAIELLSIADNRIRRLPDGVFQNLVNLDYLDLRNNSIDYLSVYQFGWNVQNITTLAADYNRVNAFDIQLFDQLQNLNTLYMYGNICFNLNIFNIRANRENARELLWTCFENYGIDVPDYEKN